MCVCLSVCIYVSKYLCIYVPMYVISTFIYTHIPAWSSIPWLKNRPQELLKNLGPTLRHLLVTWCCIPFYYIYIYILLVIFLWSCQGAEEGIEPSTGHTVKVARRFWPRIFHNFESIEPQWTQNSSQVSPFILWLKVIDPKIDDSS